jgi:DNA end-binding protein Ku
VLVPGKKATKGYVLLREVLKRSGRIGIARVVIRTREYLSAVMPKGDALLLMLLRYPQELVAPDEYDIPEGDVAEYRISAKELAMAEQLIESMAGEWTPGDYRDEFRGRLRKVIEKRLKAKGAVLAEEPEHDDAHEANATNVVDFMALLQQSLASKRRTPAKATTKGKRPVVKAAAKKAPGKRTANAPAKRAAPRGKSS